MVKALDISFACPPASWWQARYADGYRVMFQNLWTGGFANNAILSTVAPVNLRNARGPGMYAAGYACASPPSWWPLATQMMHIERNAGDQWPAIDRVMMDVEIPGVTKARVAELAAALNAAGKKTDILYTARWFWVGHMGNSTDPWWRRFKLLNAYYDSDPDIDFASAPYGPWSLSDVIGEQYAGTVKVDGYDVDLIELVSPLSEEVNDMTQAEFNKMFLEAVKSVPYPGRDEEGKGTTNVRTACLWAEEFHRVVARVQALEELPKAPANYTDADAVQAVREKLS